METSEDQITLQMLTVGSRLLVRSKKDWRFAAVSAVREDLTVLTICSPNGRTYRLRRPPSAEIFFEGSVPILKPEAAEDWRENFGRYDVRW